MLLHHYHPETHEWLGAGEADEDPLEPGRWLVPRFATLDPPPPLAVGEAACFEAGTWITLADHRGATYWLADGSEHTMETLGDLPNGALDAPPPPPPPTEEDLAAARRELVKANGGKNHCHITEVMAAAEKAGVSRPARQRMWTTLLAGVSM